MEAGPLSAKLSKSPPLGGVLIGSGTPALLVHQVAPRLTSVVGPGVRAVVWVQGCRIGCRGCLVPETWSRSGGRAVDAHELARKLLRDESLEGLTVSGGEPSDQPEAVAVLFEAFRADGRNGWLYSGHTLEELVARNDPAIDRLLAATDVLVDGQYLEAKACTAGFRGSRNQRLIPFNSRGEALIARARQTRLEIRLSNQGNLELMGIPPRGFLDAFERRLIQEGLAVRPAAGSQHIGEAS